MNDTPMMYSSSRSLQAYSGGWNQNANDLDLPPPDLGLLKNQFAQAQRAAHIGAGIRGGLGGLPPPKVEDQSMKKRIVQVFIADPDTRVPVENSLLHRGEEKMTDLTDQELFYEIQITSVLEKHNAYRTTVVDKQASARAGKDIFLDPIKIRDLAMNVVTIATF